MKSFVTSCMIATCAIVFVVLSMTCTVQAELIGHWTFDTDYTDSAGSHDGTATGVTIDPAGKLGGAVSFDIIRWRRPRSCGHFQGRHPKFDVQLCLLELFAQRK